VAFAVLHNQADSAVYYAPGLIHHRACPTGSFFDEPAIIVF
jgi:hypothetical protein